MFAAPEKLLLGLFTGLVFGFLLQKGQVAKHSIIVRQLTLQDWTVAKIMGTAIAVGGLGFYALLSLGLTESSLKPAELGAILPGALLFGAGVAVLGYCPGTTVAALGQGHKDALAGLAGMVFGALLFVALTPQVAGLKKAIADLGKSTWPSLTHSPAWPWLAALALVAGGFWAIDRYRRSSHHP